MLMTLTTGVNIIGDCMSLQFGFVIDSRNGNVSKVTREMLAKLSLRRHLKSAAAVVVEEQLFALFALFSEEFTLNCFT
jgi:hypothetical protein